MREDDKKKAIKSIESKEEIQSAKNALVEAIDHIVKDQQEKIGVQIDETLSQFSDFDLVLEESMFDFAISLAQQFIELCLIDKMIENVQVAENDETIRDKLEDHDWRFITDEDSVLRALKGLRQYCEV